MNSVSRAMKFYELIRKNDRVTVRRIQEETGLSRRSVYRKVAALRADLPVRVEKGVIVKNFSWGM